MNKIQLKKWIRENLFNSSGKINNRRIMTNSNFYKDNKDIFKEIESMFDLDISLLEKIYLIMNDLNYPLVCKICSSPVKFFNYTRGYQTYCSIQCQHKDDKVKQKCKDTKLKRYGDPNYNNKEKYRKTMMERYGVDHNFKSIETHKKIKDTKKIKYGDSNFNNRDKAKKTTKKKYGVDNVSQYNIFKEKRKRTCLNKYDVDNPMKVESFKKQSIECRINKYGTLNNFEKIKETNKKKYGTEYIWNSSIIKEKIKKIFIDKYGVDNPFKSKEIQNRIKQTNIEKYSVLYGNQKYIKHYNQWINDDKFIHIYNKFDNIEDICNYFNVSHFPIYQRARSLNLLYKPNRKDITIKKIGQTIEQYGYQIEYNNRSIIKPLEIDIVIRKNNKIVKCLEYNGIMFHSLGTSSVPMFNNWNRYRDNLESFINRDRIKLEQCKDLDIELFILREDLYLNDNSIIDRWLNNQLKYKILDKPVVYRFKTMNNLEPISIEEVESSIKNGYRIYFDWIKVI